MTQVCPNCNASVPEASQACPSCGEELDAFVTIPPPRFGASPLAGPVPAPPSDEAPLPPRPAAPPRRPEPTPEAEGPPTPPRPARERKPRPRPSQPPRSPGGPSASQAFPTAPAPAPPPPAPGPVPQAAPGYYYSPPPPPTSQPQGVEPGKFRKWLIERLGGQPGATPAPAPPQPPPSYPPPAYPAPGYPPPAYPPQGVAAASLSWPAPQAFGPASGDAHPAMPPSMPATTPGDEDDAGDRTIAFGADVARFKIPTSLMTLQICDRNRVWHAWTTIGANGVKVGRPSDKASKFPELRSLAPKHMRISVDGPRLLVEDLGAVNGVYLRLSRPVELEDGIRFRVGSHVVEFHRAEPEPPPEELVAAEDEVFWSRDLQPAAYLQFIRPDGRPGLRYPITKPDVTVLGRESRPGRPVDLALTGDGMASGAHAQIRRDGDRFWLEDLDSRNGTFVQIKGTTHIDPGDELLLGRVLLRAVDAMQEPAR